METLRVDRPRETSSLILGHVCLIEGWLTSGPGHDAERIEQFGPGVGQHRFTGRLHQDRRQQMRAVVGVVKLGAWGVVLMFKMNRTQSGEVISSVSSGLLSVSVSPVWVSSCRAA